MRRFICLCCGIEVVVENMQSIQSTEHLCRDCQTLPPKAYLMKLALTRLLKGLAGGD